AFMPHGVHQDEFTPVATLITCLNSGAPHSHTDCHSLGVAVILYTPRPARNFYQKQGEVILRRDLSVYHEPISDLFPLPVNRQDWDRHRLSDEQVRFFSENGYLAGVRILDDEQVERLREELVDLMNPAHPGHELYYEFHSNESKDPAKVLFHALGAWRI